MGIAKALLKKMIAAASAKGQCVSCLGPLRSGTRSNVCRKKRCVDFALEHELGID